MANFSQGNSANWGPLKGTDIGGVGNCGCAKGVQIGLLTIAGWSGIGESGGTVIPILQPDDSNSQGGSGRHPYLSNNPFDPMDDRLTGGTPAGTERPNVGPPSDNSTYSDAGWVFLGGGITTTKVANDYGVLKPNKAGKLNGSRSIQVKQGTGQLFTKIPDRFLVGSTGALPCIIAVIVIPAPKTNGMFQAKYNAIVIHFQAQDDPKATLAKFGKLPAGTHVGLAGGNNKDSNSTKELLAVVAALKSLEGVTLDGYFNGSGLWADNNGFYHANDTDYRK
jgi:hypothetical protein